MSTVKRSIKTLGLAAAVIAGLSMVIALIPSLTLLVNLNRFGAAITSSLLFAEVAVNLAATLSPLTVVLRGRSVAVVLAAQTAGAALTALAVCAVLDAVFDATAAAAIPTWWIALLTVRRACTATSSQLAFDRKKLDSAYTLLLLATGPVPMVVALVSGSVNALIIVSTVVQAALLVFVLPSALRRAVDPERAAEPPAWGKWLAEAADVAALPLAIVWCGHLEWTAPLAATACVTMPCWLVVVALLASEKLERTVRMIFAPVLALGFGLAMRTVVPALYGLLFPSLALHREWFAAISWAGILLLAVPLPPSWQLADRQASRAVTAVLGIAVIVAGGCLAGLPGLVFGAAVSGALQWRRKPAPATIRASRTG